MTPRLDTRPRQRFNHLTSPDGGSPIVPLGVEDFATWFDGVPESQFLLLAGALHRAPLAPLRPTDQYGDPTCTQPTVEATRPPGELLYEPDAGESDALPRLTQIANLFSTGTAGGGINRTVYARTPTGCMASGQAASRFATPVTVPATVAPPVRIGE